MPSTSDIAILGVDVGSSSVRAFLFDEDGNVLRGVRHPYAWNSGAGAMEIDANVLAGLVDATLDDICEGDGPPIAAVGFSNFWHGLVGLDSRLQPVTPVTSWGDVRARVTAEQVRREIDHDEYHRRTGCFIHPSYPAIRLRWLASGLRSAVRWWVSPSDYFFARYFGSCDSSLAMASASGLLDQATGDWSPIGLSVAGIGPELLPPVMGSHRTGLANPWAERWPRLAVTPWLRSHGDGAMASVGSDCRPGLDLALNVGTSSAVRLLTAADGSPHPGLWHYRLDEKVAATGAALSAGGNIHRWLLDTFRVDREEIEAALRERGPLADLVFDPALAGERSPRWRLDATGSLDGLRLGHEPADIAVAALDAVALQIADSVAELRRIAPDGRIIAGGGALRASPAWTQRIADAIGAPIEFADVEEPAARGAARVAASVAGIEIPPVGTIRTIAPDPSRSERFREIRMTMRERWTTAPRLHRERGG